MPSRLTGEEIDNIKELYNRGKGSIQDYARIYNVTVDEILDILDMKELKTVHIEGDQIDEEELGPTGRGQISPGEDVRVPYTTN